MPGGGKGGVEGGGGGVGGGATGQGGAGWGRLNLWIRCCYGVMAFEVLLNCGEYSQFHVCDMEGVQLMMPCRAMALRVSLATTQYASS